MYDIIYKKRNGQKLTENEIIKAVIGYTVGRVPDYQMSALLMAIYFRGMDDNELLYLTKTMAESGEIMDLSGVKGVKVDKHSTGGVGDGISLVLAPLVAACGGIVPMMSGRGLGHTGGTLDKLESIPGFKVRRSYKDYFRQLEKIGVCMVGQSKTSSPADRKLYALRDVTATVDSVPLIAASIMSKKIAEGCDALVLDVKTGSGAFMQKTEDAELLAGTMINIGKNYGKKISALITDMSQPLGYAVGNALEIKQAVDILKCRKGGDFLSLVFELGSRMLVLGKVSKNLDQARKSLEKNLQDGSALEKFSQIVSFQGGDERVIDDPDKYLPAASSEEKIFSQKTGYVNSIDTRAVGMAGVLLKAGRKTKEDAIDYGAGIIIHKKTGDKVNPKEPLATFYYSDDKELSQAKETFINAYKISANKPETPPLIYKEIN